MRFLVDAQLPPALARWLSARGHPADHVLDLGLAAASDRIVWQKAHDLGAAIVTKDEDFTGRVRSEPGDPAVVWLRIGNSTRRTLLEWFERVLPQVVAALEAGEKLVEVAKTDLES
jgi:predicted nuclease of predicted toxin-antitoxin system